MRPIKRLGIWMDHHTAHIMEFTTGQIESKNITSKLTKEVMENSLRKSENPIHNKEQQMQTEYYKQLGETFNLFDHVILLVQQVPIPSYIIC